MMRRLPAALAAVALLGIATTALSYSTYAKWANMPVTVYINPKNADVSTAAATAAIQYAMDVWNTQSGTTFHYQYGGSVNDTSTAYDNRNVVLFRNATNGSSIGTTYSWWDSKNRLLDSDIVIWDAGFTFFTGTSGCGIVKNAAYLEDVVTHELGHALGLNHSSVSSATMYPSYSYCSQTLRTLASDDISGAKSLYPAGESTPPPNSPPVVTITSPANGATFSLGSNISLAATATDTEDGNISSRIQWTDNGAAIGSGSLLSSLLGLAGVHTYVAKVTDSGGAQASSQVSVTVTLLQQQTTTGTLTATPSYSAKGKPVVALKWGGVAGLYVDVYSNNQKRTTTGNDGAYTDVLPLGTRGTFAYYLCSTGTTKCTNTVSVTF